MYSDDNLINILKDYYNNFGYPTQRKFRTSNGLPSYGTYVLRFGTFQNAIHLADIPMIFNIIQI